MKILGNGLVEIQNEETGELRQVKPEELSSFSPILANNYARAITARNAAREGSGSGSGNPSAYLNKASSFLPETTAPMSIPTPTGFDPFAIDSPTPDIASQLGIDTGGIIMPNEDPIKKMLEEQEKQDKLKKTMGDLKIDWGNVKINADGFALPQTGGGLVKPGQGYNQIKL